MVDGSSFGTQLNGTILAHQMPRAGAVHHITVIRRSCREATDEVLKPRVNKFESVELKTYEACR